MKGLNYSKHSVQEIRNALYDSSWKMPEGCSAFLYGIEEVEEYCKNKKGKVKLIVILFWDTDYTDVGALNRLKESCDVVIYSVSMDGTNLSTNNPNNRRPLNADYVFKISEFKQSDIDLINEGIVQEACVEKK